MSAKDKDIDQKTSNNHHSALLNSHNIIDKLKGRVRSIGNASKISKEGDFDNIITNIKETDNNNANKDYKSLLKGVNLGTSKESTYKPSQSTVDNQKKVPKQEESLSSYHANKTGQKGDHSVNKSNDESRKRERKLVENYGNELHSILLESKKSAFQLDKFETLISQIPENLVKETFNNIYYSKSKAKQTFFHALNLLFKKSKLPDAKDKERYMQTLSLFLAHTPKKILHEYVENSVKDGFESLKEKLETIDSNTAATAALLSIITELSEESTTYDQEKKSKCREYFKVADNYFKKTLREAKEEGVQSHKLSDMEAEIKNLNDLLEVETDNEKAKKIEGRIAKLQHKVKTKMKLQNVICNMSLINPYALGIYLSSDLLKGQDLADLLKELDSTTLGVVLARLHMDHLCKTMDKLWKVEREREFFRTALASLEQADKEKHKTVCNFLTSKYGLEFKKEKEKDPVSVEGKARKLANAPLYEQLKLLQKEGYKEAAGMMSKSTIKVLMQTNRASVEYSLSQSKINPMADQTFSKAMSDIGEQTRYTCSRMNDMSMQQQRIQQEIASHQAKASRGRQKGETDITKLMTGLSAEEYDKVHRQNTVNQSNIDLELQKEKINLERLTTERIAFQEAENNLTKITAISHIVHSSKNENNSKQYSNDKSINVDNDTVSNYKNNKTTESAGNKDVSPTKAAELMKGKIIGNIENTTSPETMQQGQTDSNFEYFCQCLRAQGIMVNVFELKMLLRYYGVSNLLNNEVYFIAERMKSQEQLLNNKSQSR